MACRGVRHPGIRAQGREIGQLSDAPGAQADKPAEVCEIPDLADPAYVAFDVGLEIVAKRLPGLELPVVNPGIESGIQNVVDTVARARLPPFDQREGQQAKQGRAPGKRLAYGVGEPELLASGQNEEAVPACLVGQNLEVGQEIGHTLDFIQDGPVAKPRKKPPRIGLREFPLIRRFQIDIVEMREGGAAERGLAGLPRSSHRDERVLLEQRDQAGCNLAVDHGPL